MTNKLEHRYFDWLCGTVLPEKKRKDYSRLMFMLHNTQFNYILAMDANRADDGVDLRYRFAHECNVDDAAVASIIDIRPCSVLEMMVALAIKCEEHIMADPDIGDRTGKWFWAMINSLQLWSMTNNNFDELYFNSVMERFINREYSRNGKGGLFTIPGCKHDLRDVEIWYQMCWYLDDIL